jgi:hypothetical protein
VEIRVARETFPAATDIPPVTRFVQSGDTLTYVGVRCADAWCNVGAAGPPLVESVHKDAPGVPATAQAQVKGWFDEQQLAVPAGGGTLGPSQFATVVPEPNLEHIESFASPQLVARVYFPVENPVYKRKFGFAQGWNTIELQGTEGMDNWIATIKTSTGNPTTLPVMRKAHTIGSVPGTARFAWIGRDEWIWIACKIGCCLIESNDT